MNAESIGRNSCYSITVDGALLLTGCLIDSDVRYWCHVFLDGVLYRYYVDLVVVQDSEFVEGWGKVGLITAWDCHVGLE